MAIGLRDCRMTSDGVAITIDIDWVPDFIIDDVASRLVAAGVRATWFVTHASPAIDRLRHHPALFELGIHPNFLPNSSHGAVPAEVLAHCMRLVPDARSMRTHSLVQSTPLLIDVVTLTPVRIDASLYVPGQDGLRPSLLPVPGGTLTRLPFCWEDDLEMYQREPNWDVASHLAAQRGLRIVNFHPVHIALNSAALAPYGELKRLTPRLQDATPACVHSLVNRSSAGTGTAFDGLLSWLSVRGGGSTVAMLAADVDSSRIAQLAVA